MGDALEFPNDYLLSQSPLTSVGALSTPGSAAPDGPGTPALRRPSFADSPASAGPLRQPQLPHTPLGLDGTPFPLAQNGTVSPAGAAFGSAGDAPADGPLGLTPGVTPPGPGPRGRRPGPASEGPVGGAGIGHSADVVL